MKGVIDREDDLRRNNLTNITLLNSAANSRFYGDGI